MLIKSNQRIFTLINSHAVCNDWQFDGFNEREWERDRQTDRERQISSKNKNTQWIARQSIKLKQLTERERAG